MIIKVIISSLISQLHDLTVFTLIVIFWLGERMLRGIFGPKRGEVTGGSRKLHNEELHNLYASPSIIRMIKEDEVGRACNTNGGEEECI
jgi:hypothetical protein